MKVYHGWPPGKIPLGYRRENPLLTPTRKNPSNVHDYNTVVSACYTRRRFPGTSRETQHYKIKKCVKKLKTKAKRRT